MERSPVVLSANYVWAYTVYYGIAALWGMLATRNGLAAILETGGAGYESVYTVLLAVVSGILAFLTQTEAARTEKYFTLAWLAIVVAYPAAVIYQWIVESDINRAAPSASTFLYLIFPFARFVYLARKTRRGTDG